MKVKGHILQMVKRLLGTLDSTLVDHFSLKPFKTCRSSSYKFFHTDRSTIHMVTLMYILISVYEACKLSLSTFTVTAGLKS